MQPPDGWRDFANRRFFEHGKGTVESLPEGPFDLAA